MKKIFIIAFSAVVFISCKKNDVNNNNSLPAQTITNISYGTDAAQKMDLYLPAGRTDDSTKLIVLVHGGAWTIGDKSDFSSYISTLQKRLPGYTIANINYRLATTTTNHFPTQENDMKSAIDFLVSKSSTYHYSQKIVLLGASAGAHMALLQAYKYPAPKILAVVDFFGPTDMTGLYNFYASNPADQLAFQILMNGTPTSNSSLYSQSSPINFVTSQSSPTIIFHGSIDDVVPVDQSTSLKNKLASVGVATEMTVYPNLGHDVWPAATMDDAFAKIETFIKANVH